MSQRKLTLPGGREVKYLVYAPKGAVLDTRHSLVIALYGAGGSLANYNFAGPAFQDLRDELDRRQYFIVVPELGPLHFMNEQAMQDLDGVLNELAKNPQIDTKRVHLLGTSMGGGSALAYAIHRPHRIRSVISHMGMTDFAIWAKENRNFESALSASFGGMPDQVPDAYQTRSALTHAACLRSVPVMCIHGSNDKTVSSSHSINLHRAIQAAGGTSVLRIVEGGKHNDNTMIGLGSEVNGFMAAAEKDSRPAAELPQTCSALRPQFLETSSGTSFGILGNYPTQPAPTLIVLSGTSAESLGSEYFLQCGSFLARQGYLCVSMDLPCHGQDHRPGEPEGLAGWSSRVDAGEDLMHGFISRAQDVLDFLVAEKHTDPKRIAVCGTSRGGFAALHFAAAEPRIRCVVAMAPVTQLTVLNEFQNMRHREKAELLSVSNLSNRLVDRGIWIAIGDQDQRVSTDAAIAFARRLSAVAAEKRTHSQVELLVLSEPGGHTTPAGSAALSANWIVKQFEKSNQAAK